MTGHGLYRRARITSQAALLAVAFLLVGPASRAFAQQEEADEPADVRGKFVEIERAMKRAEESLARATAAREAADDAARRLDELVEQKARDATGKSCDQLRREARDGSKESAEILRRLTEDARRETAKAAADAKRLSEESRSEATNAENGVRALLEETRRSGVKAREGIEWLLRLRGQ